MSPSAPATGGRQLAPSVPQLPGSAGPCLSPGVPAGGDGEGSLGSEGPSCPRTAGPEVPTGESPSAPAGICLPLLQQVPGESRSLPVPRGALPVAGSVFERGVSGPGCAGSCLPLSPLPVGIEVSAAPQ